MRSSREKPSARPTMLLAIRTKPSNNVETSIRPRISTAGKARHSRSEEHTSELQSLMRISYAVFCLKKKKKPHECAIPTQYKERTRKEYTLTTLTTNIDRTT